MNIYIKYALTAFLVVIISETAKRSDRFGGGLVGALPITTLLTLIWLFIEKQQMQTIGNHAYYTFWYVLITLPFFLIFPYFLYKSSFWLALVSSLLISLLLAYIFNMALRQFGINLF